MSANPPGWYRESPDSLGLRWWNGTMWTEQRRASLAPVVIEQPPLPDGNSVNTVWAWLLSFLPLVSFASSLPILLTLGPLLRQQLQAQQQLQQQLESGDTTIDVSVLDFGKPFGLILASLGISIGLLALVAVAAFLDWRSLGRRGVARPFHWAWGFLGSVYIVGRAVVVHRRTGRGYVPLILAVAIYAAVMITQIILLPVLIGPLPFGAILPTGR